MDDEDKTRFRGSEDRAAPGLRARLAAVTTFLGNPFYPRFSGIPSTRRGEAFSLGGRGMSRFPQAPRERRGRRPASRFRVLRAASLASHRADRRKSPAGLRVSAGRGIAWHAEAPCRTRSRLPRERSGVGSALQCTPGPRHTATRTVQPRGALAVPPCDPALCPRSQEEPRAALSPLRGRGAN